jgi:formylglycine-generating enzyme required for sulfatase activity
VFYCALGHASETYWNPFFLAHVLDGIQFALGDLPADAAPTAALPPAITNSIGMKLRLVHSGELVMGSPPEYTAAMLEKVKDPWYRSAVGSESPPRRVRISKPYYIGVHEVTVGAFRAFVDATGHVTDAEKDGKGADGKVDGKWTSRPEFNWRSMGHERADDEPVVNVTWNDAAAFSEWLTRKEGVAYRLPAEAEWEYACRAGTTGPFPWGEDESLRDAHAWSRANSGGDPRPTGRLEPNAWGLHDMIGNVYEYCADRFGAGEEIVVRGGSWGTDPIHLRSAFRGSAARTHRNMRDGFRVVREAAPRR